MNKEAPAESLDSSRIASGMDVDTSIGDVLSMMPTAVFTCDPRGRITFYNPRAEQLWGRKPLLNDDNEKFCGSFRRWSLAGAAIPREQTPMATALKTGSAVLNEEFIIERPDSSKINVRITIKTLHDKQGLTTGAIAVFQDISYWKITEENRQWLSAIIESSDDAIISKNLDGIIMSWNKGAERIFGYQEDEVIGKPVTVLMPPERYNEEPAILAGIRQGERFDHYETVRKRFGPESSSRFSRPKALATAVDWASQSFTASSKATTGLSMWTANRGMGRLFDCIFR